MEKKKNSGDKVRTGICDYLISYDCPSGYVGFPILCDLIQAALENYTDLALNLKSIYITVGKKRSMTRLCVERNLLTLIEKWEPAPKFYKLFKKIPTNAELLHILAGKMRYMNCSVYDTLLMP